MAHCQGFNQLGAAFFAEPFFFYNAADFFREAAAPLCLLLNVLIFSPLDQINRNVAMRDTKHQVWKLRLQTVHYSVILFAVPRKGMEMISSSQEESIFKHMR